MKKVLFLSAIFAVASSVFAQSGAPQKIKYQAVVRDLSGDPVANNSNIQMKVTILKTPTGSGEVYSETHNCTSNDLGLVHFDIGDGTTIQGNFSNIDWSDGPYYVKMELQINGTGYTNMSVSQLLSVPYALYAETAGNSGIDYQLDNFVVPIYDATNNKLISSTIFQRVGENFISIENNLNIKNGNLDVAGGDLNVTGGNFDVTGGNLNVTGGNLDVTGGDLNVTGGHLNITGSNSLTINDYSFPAYNPGNSDMILVFDGTTLVWQDLPTGGGSDVAYTLRTERDSIYLDTNGITASQALLHWRRDGNDLKNTNANTGGSVFVDSSNFLIRSSAISSSPTIPYTFGNGSAGLMWWGDKRAFRVGQITNASGYQNAWNSTNIGNNSIGLGTNILARSSGTFGIGWNISVNYADGGDDARAFAIGTNSSVSKEHAFSIGLDNTASGTTSMTVGINNTIIEAQNVGLFGVGNKVSSAWPDYTYNYILGEGNTSEESVDISIFGKENRTDGSKEISIFGKGNRTDGSNEISIFGSSNSASRSTDGTADHGLILGQNNAFGGNLSNVSSAGMSVLIGKDNYLPNLDNPNSDNIAIGRRNELQGESNIAIGTNNALGQSSTIAIGMNNRGGWGDNVVFGHDNTLATDARHSVVVGRFNTVNAQYTVNLGEAIEVSNASGIAGRYSVNFGRDITTSAAFSINIGNEITTIPQGTEAPNGLTINIGKDINNPDPYCIVIGKNYPGTNAQNGAYPTDCVPRFVVGQCTTLATKAHLIFMDQNNRAYFGCTGGTRDAPNFAGGSGIYARDIRAFNNLYTAGTTVVASDRKYKSNTKPLASGFENYLYSIRPFSYTRIDDETQRLNWGFMAQDVQNYFPHLVYEIDDEGSLGLNYTGFIPVLWKIAQDQQTKIDEQQAKIEELERQIEYILQKLGE